LDISLSTEIESNEVLTFGFFGFQVVALDIEGDPLTAYTLKILLPDLDSDLICLF